MKKKMVIIAAAAAAVVVLGVGSWFVFHKKSGGSDENVVYVNSVESLMNPGSDNGVINRFSGVVETQKKVDINLSQEKTVEKVYVEVGQEVKNGTPLFSYNTEKDQEDLSKAQLELERINNNIGNKSNEIAALEKEKRSAGSEEQLDYTMQIQSAQMDMKQSEYEKKSKQVEIQKLEESIANAEVKSTMDGVVKAINNGGEQMDYSGDSQAFMTIIAVGDYRIKGKVNEQNMASIVQGQPVLVHSRIDEDVTWKGTMGEIDTENPGNDSNSYFYSSGDSTTQSNSYPFYVNLDSSEGLMLGQHVYIEMDYGQEEKKAGIWIDASFVCDADGDAPYVWADNGKDKLEKKMVTLGQFDENLYQYEIADGLTMEDLITYPEDGLKEGMPTARGENGQMGQSSPEITDEMMEGEGTEGESMEGESIEGESTESESMEGESVEEHQEMETGTGDEQ